MEEGCPNAQDCPNQNTTSLLIRTLLSFLCTALTLPPVFDDCQNNIPNGYARVSGVIGWIEDQICAHSDYVPEDINCPKSLKGMKGMKGTKGTKGVKTPKSVRQRRGR